VASPIITHVIGATVMIAIIIALMNYASIVYNTTRYNNLQALYEELSSRIAARINGAVMDAYIWRINNTLIQLANPVESAFNEGYNVYVGKGVYLNRVFSRVPPDTSIYVVVSTPDNTIYGYALVGNIGNLEVARGSFIVDRYRTGFDAGNSYVENGVPFLCRMPINISERAGVYLSDYLVLVNLSYSSVNCTYLGKIYVPSRNDVRFTDSDGVTPLDYYIEYWNDTSKQALIWVKIPSLSASSSKTIYMYWGNPYAVDKSNPGIFTLIDYLGRYQDLGDLLLGGVWGIKYNNTVGEPSIVGNTTSLMVSTKYTNYGYVNIYSLRPFNLTGRQGWIIEAVGTPVDTSVNSQNYRVGFYMWNTTTSEKYGIQLIPPVIDPSIDLTPYTIIYGGWNITSEITGDEINIVIANTNLSILPASKSKSNVSIAIAQRSIGSTGEGGYVSILYKVKVAPDNIYRGLVLSNNLVNQSNQAYAILLTADTSGNLQVCTLDVDQLLNNNVEFLECQPTNVDINGEEWFYINVTIRNPAQGQGNPGMDLYIYRTDGSVVYSKSRVGTVGLPGRPDYIGPIVYYNGVLSSYNGSRFDDLIAIRYSEPVDLTTVKVVGLTPGLIVELDDGDFSVNNTADDNGVALLNVSTRPILGINNPIDLFIYAENGTLLDYFKINKTISGGTIIVYAPEIRESTKSFSAMIHASGNNIGSCTLNRNQYVYLASYPSNTGFNTVCKTSWLNWGRYLTSIGYYNGSFYYFIYTVNRELRDSNSIALPANTTPLLFRVVFGVSLEGKLSGQVNRVNTTGVFEKIWVRPFVYPEPAVSYSVLGIQNISFPKQPTVIVDEYTGYIVFSSKLMVDIVVTIDNTGRIIIIEVPRGVRAP